MSHRANYQVLSDISTHKENTITFKGVRGDCGLILEKLKTMQTQNNLGRRDAAKVAELNKLIAKARYIAGMQ